MSTDKKESKHYSYTVFLEKEQFEELQAKKPSSFTIKPSPKLGDKAYTLYSNASDACIVAAVGNDDAIKATPLAMELLSQLSPASQRGLAGVYLPKLKPKKAAKILIARDPLIFHQWLNYLDETIKKQYVEDDEFMDILYAINKKFKRPFNEVIHLRQDMIERFTALKLKIQEAELEKHLKEIAKSEEDYIKNSEKVYAFTLAHSEPSIAAADLFQQKSSIRAHLIDNLRQLKGTEDNELDTRIETILHLVTQKFISKYQGSTLSTPEKKQKPAEQPLKIKPPIPSDSPDISDRKDKKKYSYTVFLEEEQFKEIQAENHPSFEITRCPQFGEKTYTLTSYPSDTNVMAEVRKDLLKFSEFALPLLLQLTPAIQRAFAPSHLFEMKPEEAAEILIAQDPLAFYHWLPNLYNIAEKRFGYTSLFYEILYAIAKKLGPIPRYTSYSHTALIRICTAKKLNIDEGEVQDYVKKMQQSEEMYDGGAVLEETLKFYALSLLNLDPSKAVKILFQQEPDIRDRLLNHLKQLKEKTPALGKKIQDIQDLSVQKFTEMYAPGSVSSKPLDHKHLGKNYSYTVLLSDAQFKELETNKNLSFQIEPDPKFGKTAYTLYSAASDARVVAAVGRDLLTSPKLMTALLNQLHPDRQQVWVISHLMELGSKDAAGILIARDPYIFHQWLNKLCRIAKQKQLTITFVHVLREITDKLGVSIPYETQLHFNAHPEDWIKTLTAKKLGLVEDEVDGYLTKRAQTEESGRKESDVWLLKAEDPSQAAKVLFQSEPHTRLKFINYLNQMVQQEPTLKPKIDLIWEKLCGEDGFKLQPYIPPEEKKKNPSPSDQPQLPDSKNLDSEDFKESEVNDNSTTEKENPDIDEKKKNQPFHVSTRSKDMYPYRYTVFLEETQFLELQAKESLLPYIIEPCPQFGEKAYTLYSNLSDASIVGELGSDPLISRFPKLAKELLLQLIPDKQKELAAHLLKLNPNEAAEILVARDPLIFYEWLSHLAEITKTKNTEQFASILLAIGSKLNCNFRINTHDPQAMIEVFTARKLDIERAAVKNNLDAIRQGQTLRRKGSEDILDLTLRFYLGSLLRLDPKVAAEDVLQQEPEIRDRFIAYLQDRNDHLKGKELVLQEITAISLARRFGSQPQSSQTLTSESKTNNSLAPNLSNRNYPNSEGMFPTPPPRLPKPLLSGKEKILIGVIVFVLPPVGYGSYKLLEGVGKTEAAGQFLANNYPYILVPAVISVILGLTIHCRLRRHNEEHSHVPLR